MEKTTKWVICWIAAAALLALGVLGVLVYGLNHNPQLLADPEPIRSAAVQVLDTIHSGEFGQLRELLSGSPKLGTFPEKDNTPQSMLWYAYLDSLTYEVSREPVLSDSGAEITAAITCLDIRAAMDKLPQAAQTLLEAKAQDTFEESEIYDENHNLREDLTAQLLQQAAADLLADAPQTMEQEITLQLVRANGQWQVTPGDALTKLLSGFVTG